MISSLNLLLLAIGNSGFPVPTYNGASSHGELDTVKSFALTEEGVNLILSIDFRTAYTGTQALLGGVLSSAGHLTLNSGGHDLQFAISEYHDPVNFELGEYADGNWHTLEIKRTASTVTAKLDNIPLVGGGEQDATGGQGGLSLVGANAVGGAAMTNFFSGNLRNFKITDATGHTETYPLTKTDVEYSVENEEPEYGPVTAADYLQMWEVEGTEIDAWESASDDGSLEITYNGGGNPTWRIGTFTIPVPTYDWGAPSEFNVELSLTNAKVYAFPAGYHPAPVRDEAADLSFQASSSHLSPPQPQVVIEVYNNFSLGLGDIISLNNVSVTHQSWTRNFITFTDVTR